MNPTRGDNRQPQAHDQLLGDLVGADATLPALFIPKLNSEEPSAEILLSSFVIHLICSLSIYFRCWLLLPVVVQVNGQAIKNAVCVINQLSPCTRRATNSQPNKTTQILYKKL